MERYGCMHVIVRYDLVKERFLDAMLLLSQIDYANLGGDLMGRNEILDLAVLDECLCVYTGLCNRF